MNNKWSNEEHNDNEQSSTELFIMLIVLGEMIVEG